MVPVVDLSRRGRRFADEFARRAHQIAVGGHFLLGDELAAFEHEFASWLGARHAVGVSSGASALQLALVAAGVQPGDDVVVPAFTAVPTASAVVAMGANPIAADVDADTACLTRESVAAARTARTTAVIVVHLYGYPVTERISDDLVIIEDAAQAAGAPSSPRRSTATAYSFYPTKNLGGITDGGAVVTDDADLAERVRMLRVHGMVEQYVHESISQNFRMSELTAAWLRLGLVELSADNDSRRRIARACRAAAPGLRWQRDHDDHVFHLDVVRTADRDALRARLSERGVATAIHYPLAITQQPAYASAQRPACPEAELWAAECVSVPCFPEMTESELEIVCTALASLQP